MANFLKNAVNNSKILNYFFRPDYSQGFWNNSFFYSALNTLFNAPVSLLKRLFAKRKHVFDGSIFIKIVKYLADRMHIVVGLCLAVTMLVPHHLWYNEYSVYLTFLLFAVFVLKTMMSSEAGFNLAAVDYSAALFFLVVFMAGITSLFLSESFNFIIFYFVCFLALVITVSSINSAEQLDTLIKIISAAAFLTSLYGIYQWKVVGIPVNPSETDLALSQDLGGRVYSTMGNANVYGEFLVLIMPFFLALIINEKTWLKKILWALLLSPMILMLFKTGSRAAWGAFAISMLVFLLFWNIRLVPVFMIIGLVALPFLPAPIYNRILTIFNRNDSSMEYRKKIFDVAVSVLKDYWITGVGLGNNAVNLIFNRYKGPGLSTVAHTHIFLIQLWLETGLFGILSFLAMLVRMLKNTFITVRQKRNTDLGNILAASLAAISGLLVIGFVDHVWFFKRILLLFWIVAAILFAALNLARKQPNDAAREVSK
jgi:putative inorganic carbon (HCO3(-)) transporter